MPPRDTNLTWWDKKLIEYNSISHKLDKTAWGDRNPTKGQWACKRTLLDIGRAIAVSNSHGLFKSVMEWDVPPADSGTETAAKPAVDDAVPGLDPADEAWIRRLGEQFSALPKEYHYARRALVKVACQHTVHGKHLSHRSLQFLGFTGLGQLSLQSVRDHGVAFEPSTGHAETGGAPLIPQAVRNRIAKGWKDACEPGACRSDGTEGERHVLGDPAWHVARDIVQDLRLCFPICEKTAHRYRPDDVVEPKQLTDYCPICNKGVMIEPRISRSVCGWNTKFDKVQTLEQWVDDPALPARDTQLAEGYATARKELKHHHRVRHHNKKFFRFITGGIKEGTFKSKGAILVDFKSNLVLNRGHREVSGRWHNRLYCALMGVKIWLPGMDTPIVINVLSTSLSHTAFAAHVALEKAIEIVKEHYGEHWDAIKDLYCFADCGPHYRANVFAGYLLHTLPKKYNINVAHVSFCEGHGKCELDQQFSNMERPFRERVLRGDLNTAVDACEVLLLHHSKVVDQKYFYHCVEHDFMSDSLDPFVQLSLPAWAGVKSTYSLTAVPASDGSISTRNQGLPEADLGRGVPVTVTIAKAARFIGPLLPTAQERQGRRDQVGNWNLFAMGQRREHLENVLDTVAGGLRAQDIQKLQAKRSVVAPRPKCLPKLTLYEPIDGKATAPWMSAILRGPPPVLHKRHQLFIWTRFASGGYKWEFADLVRFLTPDERKLNNDNKETSKAGVIIQFRNNVLTEDWIDNLVTACNLPQPTLYLLRKREEEELEELASGDSSPDVKLALPDEDMVQVECDLCLQWRYVSSALAVQQRWKVLEGAPGHDLPFRCEMISFEGGEPLQCYISEAELAYPRKTEAEPDELPFDLELLAEFDVSNWEGSGRELLDASHRVDASRTEGEALARGPVTPQSQRKKAKKRRR